MRDRNLLAAVVAGPALFVMALWVLPIPSFFGSPDITWRQRLTVMVETPEGSVSASSVIAVTAQDDTNALGPPEARRLRSDFTGEAVALEVSAGRWLFVLLQGAGGGWAWATFDLGVPGGPSESFRILADLPFDAPMPLPRDAYPSFVTFDDIADPESVRLVDPNDLAATFGEGVRLATVTLAVTEEPVTEGRLDEVLGWLDTVGDGSLDGARFSSIDAPNRLANDLNRWDLAKP